MRRAFQDRFIQIVKAEKGGLSAILSEVGVDRAPLGQLTVICLTLAEGLFYAPLEIIAKPSPEFGSVWLPVN